MTAIDQFASFQHYRVVTEMVCPQAGCLVVFPVGTIVEVTDDWEDLAARRAVFLRDVNSPVGHSFPVDMVLANTELVETP